MADINLLHNKDDGKYSEGEEKKKKYQPKVELTDPNREEKEDPKKKQTWIQFFSMFSSRKKKQKEGRVLTPSSLSAPEKTTKKAATKEKGTFAPPPLTPQPKKELEYNMLPKDLEETPKDAPFFQQEPIIPSLEKENISPKKYVVPEPEKLVKNPEERVNIFESPKSEIRKFESPKVDGIKKNRKKEAVEYTSPSFFRNTPNSRKRAANVDVNLVPDDFVTAFTPKNQFATLGWVALGGVVLVIFLYAGLALYDYRLKNDTTKTNQDIQQLTQEIHTYLGLQQEALLLKQRIDAASELLNKHIYWSVFLEELQKNTTPNVYYESITGDIGGHFKISAVADSFESVATQMRVFENADFVKEIQVTGGAKAAEQIRVGEETTVETERVRFSVTLIANPEVFLIR